MLRYICPKCRRRIKTENPGRDVRVRCPNCQTIVHAKVKDKHHARRRAPAADAPDPQPAATGPPKPAANAAWNRTPSQTKSNAAAWSLKKWMFASIGLLATAATVLILVVTMRMLLTESPSTPPPARVAAAPDPTAPQPADVEPEIPLVMRLADVDALRAHRAAQRRRFQGGMLIHASAGPTDPPTPMAPQALFDMASPAVAEVLIKDEFAKTIARGTGFFVSRDGLLVTNHHVILGGHAASVQLTDRRTLLVEGVAAVDRHADLALLKVRGSNLAHLAVRAESLPKVGAKVFAIGNPKDGARNTFSDGIVSGVQRLDGRRTVIQTNAAIGPGSSGGPLLGSDGRVVGVISAFHRTGQNLNFAVAAPHIRRLLLSRGTVRALGTVAATDPQPTDSVQLATAWEAMDRRDFPAAERILVGLRKTRKLNPIVWFTSGSLAGRQGNPRAAATYYREAVRLKDDFPEVHFLLGLACSSLEQYPSAIAAFEKVLAAWPNSAEAHCQMAIAYGCLGRHEQAIAAAQKALEIRPRYAEAHFCKGYDLLALKRYDEAIASLTEATRINAALAEAHLFLGRAYAAQRHGWTAIRCFKNAVTARPNFADAHLELGRAYLHVRRYIDALAAFEAAARSAADAPTRQLAREGIKLARAKLRQPATTP